MFKHAHLTTVKLLIKQSTDVSIYRHFGAMRCACNMLPDRPWVMQRPEKIHDLEPNFKKMQNCKLCELKAVVKLHESRPTHKTISQISPVASDRSTSMLPILPSAFLIIITSTRCNKKPSRR